MADGSLLAQLIEALRCLPGVGPKSAQRIAFHLLERDREGGRRLARAMDEAMARVRRCERCRTLTDLPVCAICASGKRDPGRLCVVEQPSEVLAIEQATDFGGLYFVLGGRLSPIEGIGPEQIGLSLLETRLRTEPIGELILATSPTVEGAATAQWIAETAGRYGAAVTRIAHGVPLGGELESLDGATLALAFAGRQRL